MRGHHFTSMRATIGAKVMLSLRRNGGVRGHGTTTIIYIGYNNIQQQQLFHSGDGPFFSDKGFSRRGFLPPILGGTFFFTADFSTPHSQISRPTTLGHLNSWPLTTSMPIQHDRAGECKDNNISQDRRRRPVRRPTNNTHSRMKTCMT